MLPVKREFAFSAHVVFERMADAQSGWCFGFFAARTRIVKTWLRCARRLLFRIYHGRA